MLSTETCVWAKPEEHPENCVGDFFSTSITCAEQNSTFVQEPHQSFSTMDTTTVSGVVCWLSKDPIGISGGLNLYVFCHNDPVNFIDPMGLDDLNFTAPGTRDWQVVEYAPSAPGEFSLGAHGSPDDDGPIDQRNGLFSTTPGGVVFRNDDPVPYDELLNLIKTHENYEDGMTVRLNICYAAQHDYAYRLAVDLQADVLAPSGTTGRRIWGADPKWGWRTDSADWVTIPGSRLRDIKK